MSSILPENEYERLIDLTEFDLDYTGLQGDLGDLTKLAARIADTDVSLVNLIDNFTQWSVSKHGLDIQQMPREESVCQYTILDDVSLEIKDLKRDKRFSEKFYVADDPHLRYYFGVPLITSKGSNIGALCVMDAKVHELDSERKELLAMVASQVVRCLEMQRKIQLLQAKVEGANQSQLEVSHDIRGPISGIIGLAQLIKMEVEEKQVREVVELAKLIEEGGESLLELADGIMSQQDRAVEPNKNEFNCETFACKLKELYRPQAKHKKIKLEFRAKEGADILFPKKRLLQIVGNLITNSIKFTPEGGQVKVDISVEQGEQAESHRLRVVVEDSGIGMSAEKAQQILAGETDSEKGTSDERGYGFGLSLVHYLVEKAKGSVELTTKKGEGSRFVVLLPV